MSSWVQFHWLFSTWGNWDPEQWSNWIWTRPHSWFVAELKPKFLDPWVLCNLLMLPCSFVCALSLKYFTKIRSVHVYQTICCISEYLLSSPESVHVHFRVGWGACREAGRERKHEVERVLGWMGTLWPVRMSSVSQSRGGLTGVWTVWRKKLGPEYV